MILRSPGAAVLTAALFFSAVCGASAETQTLAVPDLQRIDTSADGRPVAVDRAGRVFKVRLSGDGIALEADGAVPDRGAPDDALPDGLVATHNSGLRAWLTEPTDRYRHAVLGDGIEAGGMTVAHPDGAHLSMSLPTDSVFEDRYPRFADMDDDGAPEILAVRAYQQAGGALVLIAPGDPSTPPKIVAEGPAIGTPNRWMNPAGSGDIDGDRRMEALVVITPHIGGTLTAYEWRGGALVVDHELFGFSNHAIGARELALSAVADLDGDGISEVIVPDIDRSDMTVVSFAGADPAVVARISPPGGVAHRVVVSDLDGDGRPEVTFGTGDRSVMVWKPQL